MTFNNFQNTTSEIFFFFQKDHFYMFLALIGELVDCHLKILDG